MADAAQGEGSSQPTDKTLRRSQRVRRKSLAEGLKSMDINKDKDDDNFKGSINFYKALRPGHGSNRLIP